MGVTDGCPSASAVAMETCRLVAKPWRKFWRMDGQFWVVMGDGMLGVLDETRKGGIGCGKEGIENSFLQKICLTDDLRQDASPTPRFQPWEGMLSC